jgi:hypothetical protein
MTGFRSLSLVVGATLLIACLAGKTKCVSKKVTRLRVS